MENIKRFSNLSLLLFAACIVFLFGHVGHANAAAITWDGGGNDTICGGAGTGNNWSCSQNWNTDTVPGSADTVTFNGTSTKDATVDATHSGVLTSLNEASGYTGTITLQRSLNTTSTFTQAAGTFTAGANNLDVNTTFTLSGGTFNAPSTTFFIGGAITASGTPTFNHNNGTVTIDTNGSAVLSCNNIVFNLVTINFTSGTKTINSNCSFPLGASPTITVSLISLSGTFSGSGTLTVNTGLTLNSSAVLSGFSGYSGTNLTISGTNADFSSYTTFALSNTLTLNTGTITLPNGADLFVLTINGGTFNAPSGTMTLSNNLTVTGTPTFNHNNGTVTLDGGVGVLSCGNITFNLVTFNHTSTKTINSNCSLPLGASPTIPTGNISLSGVLSGTGTLNATSTGSFIVNSTGNLSGFSGFIVNGPFTLNGATLDLSSYTTLTFNGNYLQSSGTLTAANTTTFNGSFTLTTGIFTAPSGTMVAKGSITINGGTFNHNNGTLELASGPATLSCNNVVFNLVRITQTSGGKTIGSNCNLPLGSNPSISYTVTLNGTLSGSGTLTVSNPSGNFTMNASAVLSGFTGLNTGTFNNNLFLINGANLDLSNYSIVNFFENLTISSGTLTAPPGVMEVGFKFTHSGGTFNHNNGTVSFSRSDIQQTISGSTTFYNLTKPPGNTLTFTAGTTQTILGTLTLQGSPGNNLLLRSSSSGTQWNIDPQGPRVISNVDVQDSNNINASTIVAGSSTDSGNNTNWNFTSSPLAFSLQGPGSNTYTNNTRPVFQWSGAVVNSGSTLSKYTLSVDNGDGSTGSTQATGDFTIDNIPVSGTTDVNTDKYTVHYENFSDSDPLNNSISLWTRDSPVWGPNENDGELKEGNRSWTVSAYDSAGNIIQQSGNIFVDLTSPSIALSSVNNVPLSPTVLQNIPTGNQTFFQSSAKPFTLFATITDPLEGDRVGNEVASGVKGPQAVSVLIQKRSFLLLYTTVSTTTVPITDNYNPSDGTIITNTNQNTTDKYSRFGYTTSKPLTPGTYKVTLTGNDSINNSGNPTTFYLSVGGTQQGTSQTQQGNSQTGKKNLPPQPIQDLIQQTTPRTTNEKPTPQTGGFFSFFGSMVRKVLEEVGR